MFNKQKILKNFKNKDEKLIISKIIDQINFCHAKNVATFTHFLPMIKVKEFLKLLKLNLTDLNVLTYGGFENSERVMIGFFPEFYDVDFLLFPISVIKINYNVKYNKKLSHRDFLGAILSLGINRNKIGDIIIKDEDVFCFCDTNISDFILHNLKKISSVDVKTNVVSIKDLKNLIINYVEKIIIVSSLRLDNIISSAFNISRSKALSFIRSEKVFINWSAETNCSKILKENDILTLRGFGRIKIINFNGKTKKERFIVSIIKYT